MASRATRLSLNPAKGTFCVTEKLGYATRAEALEACEVLMLKGLVSPGCHQTPYACGECGAWHTFNRRIVSVR